MAAWFQCHIHRRSFSRFFKRCNSIPLCVEFSIFLMISLSYNPAVFYNYRSYHRVRIRPSSPSSGKFNRPFHIITVCHIHPFFLNSRRFLRNFPLPQKSSEKIIFSELLTSRKLHFIKLHSTQPSSSIQTLLSAPESHRFMPFGSRALPPVGTFTLP